MKVRPMQAADLEKTVLIDNLSFSQPWPADSFAYELTKKNSRCWVIEVDGEVVAAMVIWMILDECHIATIAVHPDYRGRGFGRIILQTGMQAAYEEGARIYFLEVRAGNLVAQNLYFEFGYEIVGRRLKYYKDNGEDALLMTLDLTQTELDQSKLNFLSHANPKDR